MGDRRAGRTPVKRVLAVLRALDAGEVVSYGDVAAEAGFPGAAARGVGSVLAHLPPPSTATDPVVAGGVPPSAAWSPGTRSTRPAGLAPEGVAVRGCGRSRPAGPGRLAGGAAAPRAARPYTRRMPAGDGDLDVSIDTAGAVLPRRGAWQRGRPSRADAVQVPVVVPTRNEAAQRRPRSCRVTRRSPRPRAGPRLGDPLRRRLRRRHPARHRGRWPRPAPVLLHHRPGRPPRGARGRRPGWIRRRHGPSDRRHGRRPPAPPRGRPAPS